MAVIDRTIAESDFERFAGAARIRLEGYRSEKAQEDVDDARARFVDLVMSGDITVDSDGWPTVRLENENLQSISWSRRPRGVDRIAMDKVKPGMDNQKVYAWVGSVVGVPTAKLTSLDDVDWAKVLLVHNLFLVD